MPVHLAPFLSLSSTAEKCMFSEGVFPRFLHVFLRFLRKSSKKYWGYLRLSLRICASFP